MQLPAQAAYAVYAVLSTPMDRKLRIKSMPCFQHISRWSLYDVALLLQIKFQPHIFILISFSINFLKVCYRKRTLLKKKPSYL